MKTITTSQDFPIPARLNLAILAIQLALLSSLLWLAGQVSGWGLAALAAGYGIAMNSGYALLHEAEHNLFYPERKVNQIAGVLLALFILTGFFWIVIVLGNLLALLKPSLLEPRYASFDRPTAAFLASLNPKFVRLIRVEALSVFLLHGSLVWFGNIPLWNYAAVLFGFGFSWSAMQYVHHFGTVRDVQKGARNLRTFGWLDRLWLNHNWHLNHHLNPTVPWIHLPRLYTSEEFARGNLFWAYLKMWRGPRFNPERVENIYAGAIIR
jgi:fatty acid desaturase